MGTRLYVLFWFTLLAVLTAAWPWYNARSGEYFRYWLGWSGFGVICLTNLYILRKKIPAIKDLGNVSGWLNFHIFCGLIGPTLIIFHSNFRVNGLVAISFWSMMISATSGVVGRYFYTQILQQRGSLKGQLRTYDQGFVKLQQVAPQTYSAAMLSQAKSEALRMAFGGHTMKEIPRSLTTVIIYSILGDIQFYLKPLPVPDYTSRAVRRKLKEYGVMQRKLALLDAYKRLMGYWHTFHVPFAVFMYVVAIIHIVAELLFRVK